MPTLPRPLVLLSMALAIGCGGKTLATECSLAATNTSSTGGAAGSPAVPPLEPEARADEWVPACPEGLARDISLRDLEVSPDGAVFISEFSADDRTAPGGQVLMCSESTPLSRIAVAGPALWADGPELVTTPQHLLMGSVVSEPREVPASILEWKDGALHPFDAEGLPSPQVLQDRVFLAENAGGALFSIYPNEAAPALREYHGFEWLAHSTQIASASLLALAVSPNGQVYVAHTLHDQWGSPVELLVQRLEQEQWTNVGDFIAPADPNPALRFAPDDTLYVGLIDNARHTLRVLHLVEHEWQQLEPALDVYDTRERAQLEIDAQGNPVVVADDLQAGTSSVFAWRQQHWGRVGPPLADRAGCSYVCPALAVAPNGTLYAMGTLNGKAQVLRYVSP